MINDGWHIYLLSFDLVCFQIDLPVPQSRTVLSGKTVLLIELLSRQNLRVAIWIHLGTQRLIEGPLVGARRQIF